VTKGMGEFLAVAVIVWLVWTALGGGGRKPPPRQ